MNQISPSIPSIPSIPSAQIAGNNALLKNQAQSPTQAGQPKHPAAGQLQALAGFVEQVTKIFGEIRADLNAETDAVSAERHQRQAAEFDLFGIKDALADYGSEIAGDNAVLTSQAQSPKQVGQPQHPAAGQLQALTGFVARVTEIFGNIRADINAKINALNDERRQRQAAMFDLFKIRDALADYRSANPDQEGAIDLAKIEITLSKDSPLGGGGTVTLTVAMDYYRKQHDELKLPDTPKTAGELKSYMERIDKVLEMVLEPASQASTEEMGRLTQQARAMEQLQATLYQMYFDALKKYANAS